MDGASPSLAVADGTFLSPSVTQTGQHAWSGSTSSPLLWFPSAPFFGGNLFLINGDFALLFLNMAILIIIFYYFLSFLYTWSRVSASTQFTIVNIHFLCLSFLIVFINGFYFTPAFLSGYCWHTGKLYIFIF